MQILDPDGQPVPSVPPQSTDSADRPTDPAPGDVPTALVRHLSQVWNTGALDALDQILAADFTAHYRGSTIFGRAAWKLLMAEMWAHHTRITCASEELIAEGNLVADSWIWRSIERETGEQLLMYGVTLHRIAHGRLLEQWTATHVLTPGPRSRIAAVEDGHPEDGQHPTD